MSFSPRWAQPNTHQARSFTVPGTYNPSLAYQFRVVAKNTVGYGLEFPSMTVQSVSDVLSLGTPPLAPTNLVATLQAGPQVRLTWRDNAINENGFVIERSTDGVNFTQIATAPARSNTGNVTFTDTSIKASQTTQAYTYRVAAANVAGLSAYATSLPVAVSVVVPPAAPSGLTAVLQGGPQVALTWVDNANNETGFMIQRSTNGGAFSQIGTFGASAGTGATVATVDASIVPSAADATYSYRVAATNAGGTSAFSQHCLCDSPSAASGTQQPDRGQRRGQKQGALGNPGLE